MTGGVHPAAAHGFGSAADAYERGRPGYPDDAVAFLIQILRVGPSSTVLDLGAGTGKFTALLGQTGATLVAVEPVDAMRAKLRERVPSARALSGAAESIPLDDATVDAVVVAQAFHWFDGDRALSEIHRVLRAGGRLGLIWNVRDEDTDWVARITQIIDPHEGGAPRYRTGAWREAFERTGLFGRLHHQVAYHIHLITPDAVVDRVLSISFIASLEPARREEVAQQVRQLLRTHPDVAGRERIPMPYRTEVQWCERR